jgi:hypothetical protein
VQQFLFDFPLDKEGQNIVRKVAADLIPGLRAE